MLNRIVDVLNADNQYSHLVTVLKSSLTAAKVMLTKIASPVYSKGKCQDTIISQTSNKNMVLYSGCQRESIYHTATAYDVPAEVLEKILAYLLPIRSDLVSPSTVCRTWNTVSQYLLDSCISIRNRETMCGLELKSLVLGLGSFSMNALNLDMNHIDLEAIGPLARIASRTLSILKITFQNLTSPKYCNSVLDTIFNECRGIKQLNLLYCQFGPTITTAIKNGLYRLSHLELIGCYVNFAFIGNTPILKLQSFSYHDFVPNIATSEQFINMIVFNYNTITKLHIGAAVSSASIVMISECCRDLEQLSFLEKTGGNQLIQADIEAIASLPNLSSLDTGSCCMEKDAISAMDLCKSLRHLKMYGRENIDGYLPMEALRVVGRNLTSLGVIFATCNTWIVKFCPNLKTLDIANAYDIDEQEQQDILESLNYIKSNLNSLECMTVNGLRSA